MQRDFEKAKEILEKIREIQRIQQLFKNRHRRNFYAYERRPYEKWSVKSWLQCADRCRL